VHDDSGIRAETTSPRVGVAQTWRVGGNFDVKSRRRDGTDVKRQRADARQSAAGPPRAQHFGVLSDGRVEALSDPDDLAPVPRSHIDEVGGDTEGP
jgi:hypothetical protein